MLVTLSSFIFEVHMNTNTCKSFAALSLGRVSKFGKDPVYAASEKVDRKSAEHLF